MVTRSLNSISVAHRRRNIIRAISLAAPTLTAMVVCADPTPADPPDIVEPTIDARPAEAGGLSISERTGSASYIYSFTLPPARGVGATLGLAYSSSGPIRGEVASGFSLTPVFVIQRDVLREQAGGPPQYTAHFGGSIQELVQVSNDAVYPSSVPATSYRARVDRDFTRFANLGDSWVASTTDGHTFFFDLRLGDEWFATKMDDAWGNRVTWEYVGVRWPDDPNTSGSATHVVDYLIKRIEYSSHPSAGNPNPAASAILNPGINAHARVELDWGSEDPCVLATANRPTGLNLPPGSAIDYSTGSRKVRGALRLDAVHSYVRDDPNTNNWREVHRWNIEYDLAAKACNRAVSPRRLITRIRESASVENQSGVTPFVDGPAVTFSYGPLPTMDGRTAQQVALPAFVTSPLATVFTSANGFAISATTVFNQQQLIAPKYSMLLDIDGDGRLDLVRSTGDPVTCQASWYRNLGGTFDSNPTGTFSLPRADWVAGCGPSNLSQVGTNAPDHCEAECSLAGSWSAIVDGSPVQGAGPCGLQVKDQQKIVYEWMDADGDGRIDLVAQAYENHGTARPLTTPGNSCSPWRDSTWSFPKEGDPQAGHYRWRFYRNVGAMLDNDAASPTSFWSLPVALAGLPGGDRQCGPLLMGTAPPDPQHLLFAIADVNGDRLPDIITQTPGQPGQYHLFDWRTTANDGTSECHPTWCPLIPTVATEPQLNVYFGTGGNVSSSPVPMALSSLAVGCDAEGFPRLNPSVFGSVLDINNDGLADFLANQFDGYDVLYNGGLTQGRFSPPLAIFRLPPSVPGNPNNPTLTRQQLSPAFPRDFDLDGLIDFPCLDPVGHCNDSLGFIGIAFGNGAGFNSPSLSGDPSLERFSAPPWYVPSEVIGATAKISEIDLPSSQTKLKRTLRDFLDLDGDGVAERYEINPNSAAFSVEPWSNPPNSAPGRLIKVENGLGGDVEIHYARSTDGQTVRVNHSVPAYANGWNDWIQPQLPAPIWVVKEKVVDDGRGNRFTTSYSYEDPVFASDDPLPAGPGIVSAAAPGRRFRGFQKVVTTLPANTNEVSPSTFERFTYRHDPDGLLDYKALYEFVFSSTPPFREGYITRTVDRTIYQSSPVLGGTARFPHVQSSGHTECLSNFDLTACDRQASFTTTTAHAYTAFAVDGTPNTDATHTVLYGNESSIEDTTTPDGGTVLERKHEVDHLVIDNEVTYFVLAKKKIEWAGSGAAGNFAGNGNYATTIVAREDYFYDNSPSIDRPGNLFGVFKAALTRKRVYRDLTVGQVNGDEPCRLSPRTDMTGAPSEPVCVDHGQTYDLMTGNRLHVVKPAAMAQTCGGPTGGATCGDPTRASAFTEYQYDVNYALFPIAVTNEAGHTLQRTYDLGTGKPLTELGPNFKTQQGCSGGAQCIAFASRSWQYDGLGRLLSGTDSKDDVPQPYGERTIRTLSYPDFSTRIETRPLDWDSTTQTLSKKEYDGIGRLVRTTIALDGQSFGNGSEVHSYTYDARNHIATVFGPDPSNDGATITHAFTYDALGRVTSMTAPDNARATITYAPWEKTLQDPDGDVNHQLTDGFGQLRQVDESGTASSDVAHTFYDYDGAGRLVKVHDADGHDTLLAHDGQGHRRLINRLAANGSDVGRNWLYSYDADGNVVTKQDPDNRITQYGYDALGRLLQEDVIDARLPVGTNPADLGLGRTAYTYDQGANATGKVSHIAMYDHLNVVPTDVPYASVDYSYDSLGNRAGESWLLSLPAPANGTRQLAVAHSFGPQGNLLGATYPTGQTASWTYDGRGKVQIVSANNQQLARYSHNVAGLPTTRFTAGIMQVLQRTYGFDVRGRLVNDAIAFGGGSLGRTYGYSPDGDVRSIRVQDSLGDRPALDTTMNFTYDALHRILTARGGSGLSYEAGFTYTPAGNIATATVLNAGSEPDRDAALASRPVLLGGGVGVQPVSIPALSLARVAAPPPPPPPLPPPPPPPPIPAGITYQYGDGTNGNTQTSGDTQAVVALVAGSSRLAEFVYDNAGNMTDRLTPRWSSLSAHYIYDTNDHVRQVWNASGHFEKYYYVNHERFLAVGDDGSSRFYLGGEYELDVKPSPAREEQSVYIAAGEPIARLTTCTGACQSIAPSTTLLYADRRGDLLAAVSPDGVLQSHFIYGAFGEVLYEYQAGDPSASDWRRRFNGKEWDAISGLSYYGYRFYDALTLRWTTSDPLNRFAPEASFGAPQKLNLYSFDTNNPLRFLDSDGRQEQETLDAVGEQNDSNSTERSMSGEDRAHYPYEGNDEALVRNIRRGLNEPLVNGLHQSMLELRSLLKSAPYIWPIVSVLEIWDGKNLATREKLDPVEELNDAAQVTLSASAAIVKKGGVLSETRGLAGAAEGGKGTNFLKFTRENFRENLFRRTGFNPPDAMAHHIFPQAYEADFAAAGLNIHDPCFGTWWENADHLNNAKAWNNAWEVYGMVRPHADVQEILDFGRKLAERYGLDVHF